MFGPMVGLVSEFRPRKMFRYIGGKFGTAFEPKNRETDDATDEFQGLAGGNAKIGGRYMSVTTSKQDQEFIEAISPMFPSNLLGDAIEWIADNMDPEEVFSDLDLRRWADDSGFKEVG